MIQRHEIIEEFRKWDLERIPERMKAYSDDGDQIIARVFTFVKKPTGGITGGDEEFVFPVAKVFNIGKKWDGVECKVGDLVRLKDHDALRTLNPRHEVWEKNDMRNAMATGEMTQVGQAPPKWIQNLWKNFYNRLFNPDPFDFHGDSWWSNVFYFDSGNVLRRIENIELLINGK